LDPLERHLAAQIESGETYFWHRVRWAAVARHLPQSTPFRLVDVGAGAGLVGRYLARNFPNAEYHFVEPIEALTHELTTRHGNRRDASALSKFEGFDVVTLLDVLEHEKDDAGFLSALVDKMDPGSMLILTVPALPSLWSDWDVQLGHFRRYRKGKVRMLAAHCHLRVEECSYLFPELVLPAVWRRLRRTANETTEFPTISNFANAVLHAVGLGSVALRRAVPLGTSVLLVARRP
jgi:SAM-dependent methyltransferase